MTPIIDLQPAAASRFVQGYVGAVTSAVSIAVSDDAERCCFCVFVLFLFWTSGVRKDAGPEGPEGLQAFPLADPLDPFSFPPPRHRWSQGKKKKKPSHTCLRGNQSQLLTPLGHRTARAHTHACTRTHRLGQGVSLSN